jgi:hypothetical protein
MQDHQAVLGMPARWNGRGETLKMPGLRDGADLSATTPSMAKPERQAE